jgi:hypothetical protein
LQREVQADITGSTLLDPGGAMQYQVLPVRPKDRSIARHTQLVALPGEIEAGLALQAERQSPTQAPNDSDDLVVVGHDRGIVNRHEIDELSNSRVSHEPSDQARRLREIHLRGRAIVKPRRDPEPPALARVEKRREDTWRVEARSAEKVNRPVRCNECRRLHIANKAMVANRRICIHSVLPPA